MLGESLTFLMEQKIDEGIAWYYVKHPFGLFDSQSLYEVALFSMKNIVYRKVQYIRDENKSVKIKRALKARLSLYK